MSLRVPLMRRKSSLQMSTEPLDADCLWKVTPVVIKVSHRKLRVLGALLLPKMLPGGSGARFPIGCAERPLNMLGIGVVRHMPTSGELLRRPARSQSIVVLTVSANLSVGWPVIAQTVTRRWGMSDAV